MACAGRTTRHVAVAQSGDGPPVGAILDGDPVGLKPNFHRVDPVAFLDAQFLDAGHMCLAAGKGRDDRQNGVFVDHAGGTFGGHFDAFQIGREPRTQVRHGFTALFAFVFIGQVRPHLAQRCEQPCPRRVQANVGDQHIRAGHDQRRTDREGRRRRIARHVDVLGLQFRLTGQGDHAALVGDLGGDLGAKACQHPFGVVAGRLGFDHHGFARGVQPGQQHRRFHLRRGHRHDVAHWHRLGRAHDGHGQTPARAAH